jgi:hypothetical protein
MTPSACSAISIRCAGANSTRIPFRCSARSPSKSWSAAPPNWSCTAASTTLPPPAGVSARRPHLGRQKCWRAQAAPGGLLFRGIRPARVAAHLFRRPGRARRRSHQERFRPRHSPGRHRPVLRPGLFPAAARQKTAGSRKSILRPTSIRLPMQPAIGQNGEPVVVQNRNPRRVHARQGMAVKVGRCDLLLLDSNVPAMLPKIGSSPPASTAETPGAHPPGAAARRGRISAP